MYIFKRGFYLYTNEYGQDTDQFFCVVKKLGKKNTELEKSDDELGIIIGKFENADVM